MKILIAYSSKTGCAKEMCELLASLLPCQEVTLFDLVKEKTTPVVGDFDYIVLGGSIRMAKLPRPARVFIKKNAAVLAAKPHTLFVCCAYPFQYENYIDMVFPRFVVESADECLYFGGDLTLSRFRGLERLLVRVMRDEIMGSEDKEAMLPGLLPEHVRLLADRLGGRSGAC